jgi:hypothetical protein
MTTSYDEWLPAEERIEAYSVSQRSDSGISARQRYLAGCKSSQRADVSPAIAFVQPLCPRLPVMT